VIVGAGVAGASLAYALGSEGKRVLLLERDLSEPVRIVGELLQPGGYLKLKELGLAHCVDEIDAQKVYGYAMYKDGGEALVGYPLAGRGDDVAGRSFHNGRFVMRLREAAAGCPNVDVRQATVKKLLATDGTEWEEGKVVGGVEAAIGGVVVDPYADKDAPREVKAEKAAAASSEPTRESFYAPLTVVCDGYFSTFRKKLTPTATPSSPSTFVGVILDGDPNELLPRPGHGHVVLGDPSPVLFYPISSQEVRCLVDIPAGRKLPSVASGAMGEYVATKIVPQVPEKLRAPLLDAVKKGKFKSMQNKTMPASPARTPGAVLLGDAFNMRHPLTGGGMTVAFSDVVTMRSMLSPLPTFDDSSLVSEKVDAFYARRTRPALTINTLANALYRVFCASGDAGMEEMRRACFEYLRLGGAMADGPIALLGGLETNPLTLVSHFFSVAMFGVTRLMTPLPTPARVLKGANLLKGAVQIISPIVWGEGLVRMFVPSGVRERWGWI
jgi:squalene monooxygenase